MKLTRKLHVVVREKKTTKTLRHITVELHKPNKTLHGISLGFLGTAPTETCAYQAPRIHTASLREIVALGLRSRGPSRNWYRWASPT